MIDLNLLDLVNSIRTKATTMHQAIDGVLAAANLIPEEYSIFPQLATSVGSINFNSGSGSATFIVDGRTVTAPLPHTMLNINITDAQLIKIRDFLNTGQMSSAFTEADKRLAHYSEAAMSTYLIKHFLLAGCGATSDQELYEAWSKYANTYPVPNAISNALNDAATPSIYVSRVISQAIDLLFPGQPDSVSFATSPEEIWGDYDVSLAVHPLTIAVWASRTIGSLPWSSVVRIVQFPLALFKVVYQFLGGVFTFLRDKAVDAFSTQWVSISGKGRVLAKDPWAVYELSEDQLNSLLQVINRRHAFSYGNLTADTIYYMIDANGGALFIDGPSLVLQVGRKHTSENMLQIAIFMRLTTWAGSKHASDPSKYFQTVASGTKSFNITGSTLSEIFDTIPDNDQDFSGIPDYALLPYSALNFLTDMSCLRALGAYFSLGTGGYALLKGNNISYESSIGSWYVRNVAHLDVSGDFYPTLIDPMVANALVTEQDYRDMLYDAYYRFDSSQSFQMSSMLALACVNMCAVNGTGIRESYVDVSDDNDPELNTLLGILVLIAGGPDRIVSSVWQDDDYAFICKYCASHLVSNPTYLLASSSVAQVVSPEVSLNSITNAVIGIAVVVPAVTALIYFGGAALINNVAPSVLSRWKQKRALSRTVSGASNELTGPLQSLYRVITGEDL